MNPFKEGFYGTSYLDHVRRQLEDLDVGSSLKADLRDKNASAFRMSLFKISDELGRKYKTKVVDNDLWVVRVN